MQGLFWCISCMHFLPLFAASLCKQKQKQFLIFLANSSTSAAQAVLYMPTASEFYQEGKQIYLNNDPWHRYRFRSILA